LHLSNKFMRKLLDRLYHESKSKVATSSNKEKTNMSMTKDQAYAQAAARNPSASIGVVIAEADKLLNYVNGTHGASCASVAPKPKLRTKPKTVYQVEYKNRKDSGTHLGGKTYNTWNGAYKNRRNPRYVRVITLREAS
jgi:hypothetical protein